MLKHIGFLVLLLVSTLAQAASNDSDKQSNSPLQYSEKQWQKITNKAKGQTVYFYAWGGSQQINNYLRWADKRLNEAYGVRLKHVKVTDISEAISRLVAEKTAKKDNNGSVDMVWVNGENFKSMKKYDLITDSFAKKLPSWRYVDTSLPVENDFSEPTLGLEAPWGVGQLIFIYDKANGRTPPRSFTEMLSYAQANPYKITYPQPPAFHGTSFLKSALLELTTDKNALYQAVDKTDFQAVTAPLWQYLDQLHPLTWRQGKQFPKSSAETNQLLDDGEIDLAISFNPNEVIRAQNSGELAETTEAYALDAGALSNIHFLSIPWNASAKEGALVAIDFLLSPEAQSRKGDLKTWGDPTVLQSEFISGSAKQTKLFKSVSEPHPSWQSALEAEWQKRYGH